MHWCCCHVSVTVSQWHAAEYATACTSSVRLASLIDWGEIERSFGAHFTSTGGRPALPPRLVAGLLCLQHTFDVSDEAVVNTLRLVWGHATSAVDDVRFANRPRQVHARLKTDCSGQTQ